MTGWSGATLWEKKINSCLPDANFYECEEI